ncbi:MAG: BrnT family toxin [Terriglobales bacterium]
MRFEWNAAKAAANLRKHDISFDEAATVFFDPLSATGADPDHSLDERRFVTFGRSTSGRLLVVVHADCGDAVRIITARHATPAERKLYEEG